MYISISETFILEAYHQHGKEIDLGRSAIKHAKLRQEPPHLRGSSYSLSNPTTWEKITGQTLYSDRRSLACQLAAVKLYRLPEIGRVNP